MRHHAIVLGIVAGLLAGCGAEDADSRDAAAGEATQDVPRDVTLPPGADEAASRLAASPRHGEWVNIDAGSGDSLRAFVVYPERSDRAPVVLVVHEIYGLTTWIRAVADQLAADGFIAIAPDLLSGEGVPEGEEGPDPEAATAAVRGLDPADVQRRLTAAAGYGMALPAALPVYGIVGFCWGGAASFAHATVAPDLGASVVYYGTSPDAERLAAVRAPVLGLYGADDARVNATVPAADSVMSELGLTFEHESFAGAGHGFLRAQGGRDGANLTAARGAWPRTIEWFRENLQP